MAEAPKPVRPLEGKLAHFAATSRWLLVASLPVLLLLVYLAILWAPTLSLGFSAPVAQRIFYFHIGAAIASYAAFTVTFGASLAYIRTRADAFDTLARDAAGLGLMFALMVLTSGPIWASAEWGVFWQLDNERLMTYLVLFLVYLGYFGLRARLPASGARARAASLYAIAGFALVPLSYFSIFLWRTLHPTVISPGGQGIGAQGAVVLLVSLAGFMLLFLGLLGWRLEISILEAKLASQQRGVDA